MNSRSYLDFFNNDAVKKNLEKNQKKQIINQIIRAQKAVPKMILSANLWCENV
jgi:hypothetical protein